MRTSALNLFAAQPVEVLHTVNRPAAPNNDESIPHPAILACHQMWVQVTAASINPAIHRRRPGRRLGSGAWREPGGQGRQPGGEGTGDDVVKFVKAEAVHSFKQVGNGLGAGKDDVVAAPERLGGQPRVLADAIHNAVNIMIGIAEEVEELNGHYGVHGQGFGPAG